VSIQERATWKLCVADFSQTSLLTTLIKADLLKNQQPHMKTVDFNDNIYFYEMIRFFMKWILYVMFFPVRYWEKRIMA